MHLQHQILHKWKLELKRCSLICTALVVQGNVEMINDFFKSSMLYNYCIHANLHVESCCTKMFNILTQYVGRSLGESMLHSFRLEHCQFRYLSVAKDSLITFL